VKSLDEAVEWARRCADYMPSGEWVLEIRPIFEAEDFGSAFTPELRAQEERLRAEIERQRKSAARDELRAMLEGLPPGRARSEADAERIGEEATPTARGRK
jgi:hypothetical protein